jgi:ABC-type nitrate/sulfonate/bicarbonate transport system permease component
MTTSSLSSAAQTGQRPARRIAPVPRDAFWSGTLLVLAMFAVEDVVSRLGWINPVKFPPATRVLLELSKLAGTGQLFAPLVQTLTNWAVSVILALGVGLIAGSLIGLNRSVERATHAVIEFVRPVPSTALIPLVILALGANAEGARFLTFFGTVWQVLPVIVYAVGTTDPVALDVARAYGLDRWQVIRSVRLPSMWPAIKTAIRIAASAALVLLVSMEYLAGIDGIGKEVSIAYSGANYVRMYAFITIAVLLGVVPTIWMSTWARDGQDALEQA